MTNVASLCALIRFPPSGFNNTATIEMVKSVILGKAHNRYVAPGKCLVLTIAINIHFRVNKQRVW